MKKRAFISLGIIISLIFIFFIAKNIDFKKVKAIFFEIHYIYLIPAFLVYLLSFVLRSFRWKYLLEHEKQISFSSLFSVLMIGFMSNQLLPARIGEFVRAYCLGKKENISKSLSFGTVVIERLWDALTLLFFLSIIFTFFNLPTVFRKIHYIGTTIFIGILIITIFLTLKKDKTLKLIKKGLFFTPETVSNKLIKSLDMFINGFRFLKKKRHLLLVSLLSICIWLVETSFFFIVTKSFDFSIPFYGVALIIILISVGVMIPSSPGYIGTFEGFCILGLSFFGINKEFGLSFAIVIHLLISIPIILIGLGFLWKENISWREIEHVEKTY